MGYALNATVLISLLSMLVVSPNGYGQADPEWLKSWNEAVSSRPEMLSASGRIALPEEPGIPMIIRGRVLDPNGTPAPSVVVHAYHRDSQGFDFGAGDNSYTTWRLQGWVITDEDGRFEFKTIRPAPDHLGREAAHVHMTLESKSFGRQWAPTVYLADDPLVVAAQRQGVGQLSQSRKVSALEIVDGVQRLNLELRLKGEPDF
ncbi:hypothetical protein [Simiduia aestuariiviva]|nr:hypothetical protein [Simiduia aestuariiviva]